MNKESIVLLKSIDVDAFKIIEEGINKYVKMELDKRQADPGTYNDGIFDEFDISDWKCEGTETVRRYNNISIAIEIYHPCGSECDWRVVCRKKVLFAHGEAGNLEQAKKDADRALKCLLVLRQLGENGNLSFPAWMKF